MDLLTSLLGLAGLGGVSLGCLVAHYLIKKKKSSNIDMIVLGKIFNQVAIISIIYVATKKQDS